MVRRTRGVYRLRTRLEKKAPPLHPVKWVNLKCMENSEKKGNIPLQILTNSIHGCKNAHPLKVTNNKSKQQNKHAKKKKKKNPFFKKINSQHYTHDTTSWCSDDHFVFAVRF